MLEEVYDQFCTTVRLSHTNTKVFSMSAKANHWPGSLYNHGYIGAVYIKGR